MDHHISQPKRPRAAWALTALLCATLVAPSATAQQRDKRKARTLKPATLVIVTNFAVADATVNGLPYPEYNPPGEPKGMLLPAGGPYTVEVKYGDKSRVYTVALRAYETRYLLVELSGYSGTAKAAAAPRTPPPAKKKEESGEGRVTVYSKPRGTIVIDGKDSGKKTPNTVETEVGRHEVQVRYEDGKLSEKKIVRTRKGSRIKLFFRQR